MNTWRPEPIASLPGRPWDIIPQSTTTPFIRRRLRHLDRIRTITEHVLRHDYVVLLGPPYSGKSELLSDVEERLLTTDLFTPVYVNLWRVRTDDEAAFFSSLAQTICRSQALGAHAYQADADTTFAATDFRSLLDKILRHHDRHLVLLIDHLQVLPQDLTHRLLQVLRAAYMERASNAARMLDVVTAGSAALAELSYDSGSPFNMARPVFNGPLSLEASAELARANLVAAGLPFSPGAVERAVFWAGGDSYLIPELVYQCLQKAPGYSARRITRTVMDNTAAQICASEPCLPLRAAIQAIEEDPDTVLDIVTLLRDGFLLRNQAHQFVLRTGIDRLQLSGAVVLAGETYHLKNELYRQGLRRHFGQNRVAHVLRMNGRWQEAIQYLSAAIESEAHAPDEREAGHTDLLEAIVQSIYAADREEAAYHALLEGIHLGFHHSGIRIYRAFAGRGQLRLVATDVMSSGDAGMEAGVPPGAACPTAIDLNDYAQPEVRTFRSGGFALRGEQGSKRLLAALTPERRPIGMVTIEAFSSEDEPHVQPPELPALLRFLRHASSALENVVLRAAIRKIGRAVLDAATLTHHLDGVLDVVLDAAGGDAVELFLLDPDRSHLTRVAHSGLTSSVREALAARIELSLTSHAAIAALHSRTLVAERQAVPPGLHAYLPLLAGGQELGVLVLYFGGELSGLSLGERKTLATFADQVAIAVHNHQLLRQTDKALRDKVYELQNLRRQAEQQRDQEIQDVANAFVHRLGSDLGAVPMHLKRVRRAVTESSEEDARAVILDAVQEIEKRVQRVKQLEPPLREIADLATIQFRPVALADLIRAVVADMIPPDGLIVPELHLEEGILVDGSRSLLFDALRSLLENACDAMTQGGPLTVWLFRQPGGEAAIRIEDKGVGIPPSKLPKMFQPGFSTKPRNTRGRSRGLGLFTCRAIVRKHGGDIHIVSVPAGSESGSNAAAAAPNCGSGTTVTVVLPLLGDWDNAS